MVRPLARRFSRTPDDGERAPGERPPARPRSCRSAGATRPTPWRRRSRVTYAEPISATVPRTACGSTRISANATEAAAAVCPLGNEFGAGKPSRSGRSRRVLSSWALAFAPITSSAAPTARSIRRRSTPMAAATRQTSTRLASVVPFSARLSTSTTWGAARRRRASPRCRPPGPARCGRRPGRRGDDSGRGEHRDGERGEQVAGAARAARRGRRLCGMPGPSSAGVLLASVRAAGGSRFAPAACFSSMPEELRSHHMSRPSAPGALRPADRNPAAPARALAPQRPTATFVRTTTERRGRFHGQLHPPHARRTAAGARRRGRSRSDARRRQCGRACPPPSRCAARSWCARRPSLDAKVVGTLRNGQKVTVPCSVDRCTTVRGSVRTTNRGTG